MELQTSRVDARRASVPRGQTRLSNLDSSGFRIVRKGSLVSYGGLRLRVWEVRTGYLIGYPVAIDGTERRSEYETLSCHCVQVLA